MNKLNSMKKNKPPRVLPPKTPARKSKRKRQFEVTFVPLDHKGLIFLTYKELPENKEKKTNDPRSKRKRADNS